MQAGVEEGESSPRLVLKLYYLVVHFDCSHWARFAEAGSGSAAIMTVPSVVQTVTFPDHRFAPEDLLTFVQTSRFSKKWDGHGLSDEDLHALEILIMLDPRRAPVIKDTGGLRKVRFAGGRMNRGRRDALRICYVYFEEFNIVLLLSVYAKNEQGDLTADEKAECRKLIAKASQSLARGGAE